MLDTNNFNYSINAVSGTLRKSHPKSKMRYVKASESLNIFKEVCPCLTYQGVEIVILQIMLVGEGNILIEYVLERDFEKASEVKE